MIHEPRITFCRALRQDLLLLCPSPFRLSTVRVPSLWSAAGAEAAPLPALQRPEDWAEERPLLLAHGKRRVTMSATVIDRLCSDDLVRDLVNFLCSTATAMLAQEDWAEGQPVLLTLPLFARSVPTSGWVPATLSVGLSFFRVPSVKHRWKLQKIEMEIRVL